MKEPLSQEWMADGDAQKMRETKSADRAENSKEDDIKRIKGEVWIIIGHIGITEQVEEKRNTD